MEFVCLERSFGDAFADGGQPGEPGVDAPADDNTGQAAAVRRDGLGSEQHPLYGGQRTRETEQALQEVVVREESADRARLHHVLSIHGRSTRRRIIHGL